MIRLLALLPLCLLLLPLAGCDTTCDPGDICPWYGTGEAGLSPEGTQRLEGDTFWTVDMAWNPVNGQPYVMDWNNHRVITLDGGEVLRTVTGIGGELGDGPEGPALQAEWNHPTDAAWLSDGTMVLAAWHNSRVATLDPTEETVAFIAGTGGRDFAGDGGPATEAILDLPCGVVVDEEDNIYIADMANQRIRRLAFDGDDWIIDTVAGTGEHGFTGDGLALEVQLASPALQRAEPAFKMDYSDGVIYLADTHNGRIRAFDIAAGTIVTLAGMGQTPPDSDNGVQCTAGCGYDGDGGPATEAMLNTPSDVAVAPDGTLYIADTDNHCVRKVDPQGTISTFAGVCTEQGEGDGDFGPATEAHMNSPFGVEVGPNGAVYIADTYNNRIRVVQPE